MTILEKANAVLAEKNGKLLPENIKKDVVAFGVTGTLVSLEEGSANATATDNDIRAGEIAFVNGVQVVGTLQEQTSDVSQIVTNIENVTVDADKVTIMSDALTEDLIMNTGVKSAIEISNVLLAEALGISAGIIKEGETILGITGTYSGPVIDEGGE